MRSRCLGTLLRIAAGIGATTLVLAMAACSSPPPASKEKPQTQAATPQPAPRRRAAPKVHRPIPFKWRSGFQLPNGEPKVPRTFAQAKQLADSEVYKAHRVTFYRRCDYSADGKLDTSRCGLAKRMKWARTVPLSAFGPRRFCWNASVCKTKGLACCRKIDPDFRRMESDLHNLVPVAAELKSQRRGFHFGNITGEPPASVRGDIARTYLYMHFTYKKKDPKDWLEEGGLPLTQAQIQRFLRWHQQDPPDAWELQRDQRIADLQGGHNGMLVPWRKLHCGECTDEKLSLLISNLKAPETVTELEIDPGKLTAAGLVHVAKLKNLRELGLTDWNVYVDVWLANTHVGDAALEHLAKIPSLTDVFMPFTEASQASVQRFMKRRPDCNIGYCHRRTCPRTPMRRGRIRLPR